MLVYIFPALVDLLLGSFTFVATVRLAESGASPMAVGAVISLWGGLYMVTCFLVGRTVTPRRAGPMMLGSCVAMIVACMAFLAAPSLTWLYIIMASFGIVLAFFFVPFQPFLKEFGSRASRGVAYSSAAYTVSWSLGMAVGPFVAGFVWRWLGWRWVFVIDGLIALGVTVGLAAVLSSHRRRRPVTAEVPPGQATEPAGLPDLAWLGWLTTGTLLLGISSIRGVFPSSAAAYSIPKDAQGVIMSLICFGQAAAAFMLRRNRTWMYQPLPVAAFGGLAITGMVLFGLSRSTPLYCLAATCTGLATGAGFIYLVYHALIHPSKAGRYTGMNESVVGLTGIIGPAAAGYLATQVSLPLPYYVCAGLYAAAITVAVVVHARMRVSVHQPH